MIWAFTHPKLHWWHSGHYCLYQCKGVYCQNTNPTCQIDLISDKISGWNTLEKPCMDYLIGLIYDIWSFDFIDFLELFAWLWDNPSTKGVKLINIMSNELNSEMENTVEGLQFLLLGKTWFVPGPVNSDYRQFEHIIQYSEKQIVGPTNEWLSENTDKTSNKHPACTQIDYLEVLFTILLQITSMWWDL